MTCKSAPVSYNIYKIMPKYKLYLTAPAAKPFPVATPLLVFVKPNIAMISSTTTNE